MAADKNWKAFLDYLDENSHANTIEHFEDEEPDENGISYGDNHITLIWDQFFRGEEENDKNRTNISFGYGYVHDFDKEMYSCRIIIKSPQVNIHEQLVGSTMKDIIKKAAERIEVYKETLYIGYKCMGQMDNDHLSRMCNVLNDWSM
jgi:hypothetical protein